MSTTATTKPRPLRLNQRAVLVPTAQLVGSHEQAILTAGLTELDQKVLDTIADWYRRLYVEHFAGSLSYERMANKIGADIICLPYRGTSPCRYGPRPPWMNRRLHSRRGP